MSIEFPKELLEVEKYNQYLNMVISSQHEAEFATDLRKSVKDELSQIEKTRKSFTEPLMESKKRIDEQAKRLAFPREKLLESINLSLLGWHNSQEEVRLEEQKRKREEELKALEFERVKYEEAAEVYGDGDASMIASEIERNAGKLLVKPIEITRNTKTATATAYVSTYWDFEIVDIAQVPKEYFTLDEKKLRKVCVAMKENTNIPGIKAIKKQRIGG